MSIRAVVSVDQAEWQIAPVPAWVVTHEPQWDFGSGEGPALALLLIDEQHHVPSQASSHRTVRRVLTHAAVQANGQAELDFDPAAHRLLIHELAVWRQDANGAWEKRSLAERGHFLVRQREQQFEQQMLNGRVSIVALLEDLRVDDAIEMAWTLEPLEILPGLRFATFFAWAWMLPVARVFFTLHGIDSAPLRWRLHASEGNTLPKEMADATSVTWALERPQVFEPEPNVPGGHWPFAMLDVTAWESWSEVANFVAELWTESLTDATEAVKAEAKRLLSEAADPSAAAREAIRLVQENVRYLAVDFGVGGGMLPNGAGTILRRRFGDCKDKSVLLVALLRALGFEAWPMLVGANWRNAVARVQPSTCAFSHAIVSFRVEGRAVFVDPTMLGQGGSLAELIPPPYGCGLELRPDATGLIILPALPPAELVLEETFELESRTATSNVRQKLRATAWLADDLRACLTRQGEAAFMKQRVEALQRQFPAITGCDAAATVQDEAGANAINWSAQHALPNWSGPGQPSLGMFRYGAHGLMLGLDILEGPEQRQQPWALRFPMRLHHRVVVRGKCVQKTKPETHRVNGPGFRYSCDVRSARRQVSFDYVWETTAPEISPAEWRDYCQEREKAFAVAGANVLTRRADIKLTWGLIAISGFLLAKAVGVFLSPDTPRPAPVDTQTIQQQMRVATDAINNGDYERARLLLAPLAPHYEDSAEYHLLDAKAALETGDLNSARRAIDLARALSVDLVAADVLEGLWHERRGDLPRARIFYEKALTGVPDDAQTLLLLAPVLEQLGDLTAAKQLWEKFLTVHPAHPDSVLNYALLLWRNGERNRADAMIHGIIQAQPVANANLESNLSSYYTNTGRHAEALAAAKRAVDLAPKAPNQIFIYTMALLQNGKAIAAFDFVKGKAQEGTHPQVWRALAIAAASANQRSEAERAFKEWQAASPGDPDAQSNYGFFLLQTGRAPEARALLERGIHEFPDNGMMWLNYSAVLSALGDPEAAAARAKAEVLTPARTRETLIR